MASLQRKPKNQRSKRALHSREPKIIENTKKSLIIKGPKTSDVVVKALKDVHSMKKPNSIIFQKKNMTRPFDDHTSVEFLSQRNDCSLLCYGSNSKKRPHNLVWGRFFDHQMIDLIETSINGSTFKTMQEFSSGRKSVVRVDSKPCFVFMGDDWGRDPDLKALKSLFLDFFRGFTVESVDLAGMNRVIVMAASEKSVYFRHYGILLKKSGSRLPKVVLEEVGPRMDLTVGRRLTGSNELRKMSMRQARAASVPKKKNISRSNMGDKLGRVHMNRQDFSKLELAKTKGLKKRNRPDEEEDAGKANAKKNKV